MDTKSSEAQKHAWRGLAWNCRHWIARPPNKTFYVPYIRKNEPGAFGDPPHLHKSISLEEGRHSWFGKVMAMRRAVATIRSGVLNRLSIESSCSAFLSNSRGFAAGTYLDKDEVTQRVLNIVKNFDKVDPAKVSSEDKRPEELISVGIPFVPTGFYTLQFKLVTCRAPARLQLGPFFLKMRSQQTILIIKLILWELNPIFVAFCWCS